MKNITTIVNLISLHIRFKLNSFFLYVYRSELIRRKKIKAGAMIVTLSAILSSCGNTGKDNNTGHLGTCYVIIPPPEEFSNISFMKDTSLQKKKKDTNEYFSYEILKSWNNTAEIIDCYQTSLINDTPVTIETPYDTIIPTCYIGFDPMPEYPGGIDSMFQFLSDNIKYPQSAIDSSVSGTVYLHFTIEADGSISDVEVVKGFNKECEDEALRVVKMMPKWRPGKEFGKPIRVQYTLPIKYTLDD